MATFNFDHDFQVGILALMTQESDFLLTASSLIRPEYFENKMLIWAFQRIKEYDETFKEKITKAVFHNELKKSVQGGYVKDTDISAYTNLIDRLDVKVDAKSYVTAEVVRFCRRQEVRREMIELAPLTDSQDNEVWDQIETRIQAACSVGAHAVDIGTEFFRNYVERLRARMLGEEKLVIPTGVPDLDGYLNGGLKAGQLGIWMGASGMGKSIALPQCGKRAITAGLKVLHYTLELDEVDIAERYDSSFSLVPVHDLKGNHKEVDRKLKYLRDTFGNSLIIKWYPTGSATVATLRQHLNSLRTLDFIPDLLLVDYGDLLKPQTSYDNEYSDLGAIFKDLRGLAGELQIPIWTACLTGDTLIETPSGQIPIKDLVGKVGHSIYAIDRATKKVVTSKINACWLSNPSTPIWKVTLDNGEVVRGTPTHPFMLRDGTYRRLDELQPGDSLMPFTRYRYRYGSNFMKRVKHPGGGWNYESHLVAQWKYGRPLEAGEVVHHMDGNHDNDDPNNLEYLHRGEHIREHRETSNPMWNAGSRAKMIRTVRAQRAGTHPHNYRNDSYDQLVSLGHHLLDATGKLSSGQWDNCSASDKDWPSRALVRRLFGNFTVFKQAVEAHNHKVVSVESCHSEEAVYNLEVETHHNYALAAGVFVKNTQTNRAGMQQELPDIDSIADSLKKAQIADVVIAITATREELDANILRLFIAKNRNGPPKKLIKIRSAYDRMCLYDPFGPPLPTDPVAANGTQNVQQLVAPSLPPSTTGKRFAKAKS